MTLSESYSSIQLTKYRSYDEFQKKLEIWLGSSSKGWGYEKHEINNQIILWAKSWTGTAKFIIINKSTQSTEETPLSLYAGVLTNLSIFRFTQFPLNLKRGWTSYFPRKFALKDFLDLITFLDEDPKQIIHHQMPFPIFLKKALKGLLFTDLIIIAIVIVSIGTYITFLFMDLAGIGVMIVLFELFLCITAFSRILANSLNYTEGAFFTQDKYFY